jgi:hypothetical protein
MNDVLQAEVIAWTLRYVEGCITETELAHKLVLLLTEAGCFNA